MLHDYDKLDQSIAKHGPLLADLYPNIAPSTSHGVHMPMHIKFCFGHLSKA